MENTEQTYPQALAAGIPLWDTQRMAVWHGEAVNGEAVTPSPAAAPAPAAEAGRGIRGWIRSIGIIILGVFIIILGVGLIFWDEALTAVKATPWGSMIPVPGRRKS